MSEALTLNPANVETVLDTLRPYLMADGGNVELVDIDGPIVKLRLQGACGSCPSSTMTLKIGHRAQVMRHDSRNFWCRTSFLISG
jgi:Fe-S cluster biogenesis protein NfuA